MRARCFFYGHFIYIDTAAACRLLSLLPFLLRYYTGFAKASYRASRNRLPSILFHTVLRFIIILIIPRYR